jgi:hypothetical protein
MSETARPTWIIEREVSRGRVRIGVIGWRFVAELNLRRVALTHNDIYSVQDLAASRYTARQATQLRQGGYSHLLGGAIGLLPGEAKILNEVARGTPEGLVIHRAKLIEALEKENDDTEEVDEVISDLAHHGDEHVLRVSPARQALLDFDRAHPDVAARKREPDTNAVKDASP